MSAADLLERARDEHADPFTNAALVTFSRLRKKLGEPPVIETVANAGYRIIRASRTSPAHTGNATDTNIAR